MEERINAAWDAVIDNRRAMLQTSASIADAEATAIQDDLAGYMACKNGEQRRAFLNAALAGDEHYQAERLGYRNASRDYKLARLEVERLRMLIDSARVGVAYGV